MSSNKPRFVGENASLSEVCVLTMGQSPSSESCNADHEGLPFFQGNADFGKLHPTARSWCTEPKKLAEAGDILLSVRAPIGAVNVASETCCIGRGLASVRPGKRMSVDYVRHFLYARRRSLESMGTGSTFKAIGKKQLSTYAIPTPSLADQKTIAGNLEAIQDLINFAESQVSLLDQLVKSRFVEMFETFKCSSSLNEVIIPGTRISYGIVQPGPDGTGDMGVLRPVDIVGTRLSTESVKRIDPAIGDSYRRTLLEGNEILTVVRGATGQTVKSTPAVKGMNVTRGIAVIRYDASSINPDYLVGYMNSDDGQRYIADHTQGATLQQINIADLKKMPLPLPPLDLQQQFAEFVAQVDKSRFDAMRNPKSKVCFRPALRCILVSVESHGVQEYGSRVRLTSAGDGVLLRRISPTCR